MNSKLGFSAEERSFVAALAASKEGSVGRIGFYAAALVPASGFGVYGLISSDFLALALAFAGLLFFSIWQIARELKYAPVFSSIFAKIDAIEREGER